MCISRKKKAKLNNIKKAKLNNIKSKPEEKI